jgi:anhydro-N-acetylmuramic acid kinase
VPAFHRAIFGRGDRTVAVLNLGGIANLSLLSPDGATTGFDCGPANTLLDLWCQRTAGDSFDRGGAIAARGTVDARLLEVLRAEPYFALAPPKSTGLDLFNTEWLDLRLANAGVATRLATDDVQATLAELTARVCADACRHYGADAAELIVCGGGAFNADLMARLCKMMAPTPVVASNDRGLPPDQVEAAAFAWLARAFVERAPGNLASVTGAAGPRLLGALYPAG